jgi:excinuclease UvrABC ATPase subunit
MIDQLAQLADDTRIMVLAPVVAGRKGEQANLLEELRAQASPACASTARSMTSTRRRISGRT